ncbi:unnamed protein product [Dicrocoelium dendriticum]|nr:unnamed protein product [Dicrocoelium dendriticum]
MTNLNIMDLNLQQPFAIRIAVRFVGDDSTGEWHSVYGSATEVMHTAETTCSKYAKRVNTTKSSDDNQFNCTVTGPHRGHVKGEFLLYFALDEADTITAAKEALEKRNPTGIGYDITALLIKIINATP